MIRAPRLLIGIAFVMVAGCDSSGEDSRPSVEARISTTSTALADSTTSSTTTLSPQPPASIACTVFHRPMTSAEGEEQIVSVDRTTNMLGEQITVEMGEFTFGLRYAGDVPEGESIVINVGHSQGDSGPSYRAYYSSEEALLAARYGFTGLQMLEVDGFELQWWCSAE